MWLARYSNWNHCASFGSGWGDLARSGSDAARMTLMTQRARHSFDDAACMTQHADEACMTQHIMHDEEPGW